MSPTRVHHAFDVSYDKLSGITHLKHIERLRQIISAIAVFDL